VKVRLITSLREFDALGPLWLEMTTESKQASPFLSHDWFACCWRTAGAKRDREVWLLEDSAGPVAFVPLVRWKTRLHGLPVRMARLMDSPDTPFVDLPIAGPPDEVIGAFVKAFRQRRDWDILTLQRIPARSRTIGALETALSEGLRWRVAGTQDIPYLAITHSWDEFLQRRTQRFRKTSRNVENRLRRAGRITVEEHRDVDPEGPLFAEVERVASPVGPAARRTRGCDRVSDRRQRLHRRASR
jgi:hypothetical protein